MTDDSNSKLPPEIQRLLKQAWLGGLRDTPALDTLEIELFAWYLRETDSLTSRMESEELEYVRQKSDSGDPEPNDSGLVVAAYYSRRVRYSHVIYLASLLETVMKRECRRLIVALGEQNVPFLPSDLKGDPWSAKRKVLEKYGHFEIPLDLWKPVQQLLDVRNVLVHDNGSTDSMHQDQRGAFAKIAGVRVVSEEFEISAEYVHIAFGAVKAITDFLDKKVRAVIGQAIRPQAVR